MIKGFRRNTHDEDGNYRKELEDREQKKTQPETWIIHMLDPDKVMTFNELVKEVWRYNDQEKEPRQSKESIALGLARMIEEDCVSIENIIWDDYRLAEAHRYCRNHGTKIMQEVCGCFHCGSIFFGSYIKEWIRDETTALCPYCKIDSVLPESSGLPVNDKEFLGAMFDQWFAKTSDGKVVLTRNW